MSSNQKTFNREKIHLYFFLKGISLSEGHDQAVTTNDKPGSNQNLFENLVLKDLPWLE